MVSPSISNNNGNLGIVQNIAFDPRINNREGFTNMTKEEIKELAIKCGFTLRELKPDHYDLHTYVYNFANEIEKKTLGKVSKAFFKDAEGNLQLSIGGTDTIKEVLNNTF